MTAAHDDLLFQAEIKEAVRNAYAAIPSGGGDPVARRLYSEEELEGIPHGAVEWALGVGNPVRYAGLQPGETVLDVGSGGGIDTIMAARRVGPTGRVIGLDMLDEMRERASANSAFGTGRTFPTTVTLDAPSGSPSVSCWVTSKLARGSACKFCVCMAIVLIRKMGRP